MFADDHAFIHFIACGDEHDATVLKVINGVGYGFALVGRNEGTVPAAWDVAFVGGVGVEQTVHHACAAGVGEEFALIADEAARRHMENNAGFAATGGSHVDHFALAEGYFFDHDAGVFFVYVDYNFFDGFHFLAIIVAE